jgi:enoyl-CoA hydratase
LTPCRAAAGRIKSRCSIDDVGHRVQRDSFISVDGKVSSCRNIFHVYGKPVSQNGRGMLVEATTEGGVLFVTLRRAEKRNALSTPLAQALSAAFRDHASNHQLRLAVLRGDGDRAFASGGDLKELASLRAFDDAADMSREFRAVLESVRTFPVPVVGALNGDALGGGAELALACDMRVAAHHARLGYLQGKLAISTAWGGSIDLFDAIGVSKALRLLGRAEILTAAQARDWGLVEAVAPPDQSFDDFVRLFVAPFSQRPPQVMRAFKAMAVATRNRMPREEMLTLETQFFAETWVHDDHWRAVEASLGKAGKS